MQVNSNFNVSDRAEVANQGNSMQKSLGNNSFSKSNDIFKSILGNFRQGSTSQFTSSLNISNSINESSFKRTHENAMKNKKDIDDKDFNIEDDDEDDEKKVSHKDHSLDENLQFALSFLSNQNNKNIDNGVKNEDTNKVTDTLLQNNELVKLNSKQIENALKDSAQNTSLETDKQSLNNGNNLVKEGSDILSNTKNAFAEIESSDIEVDLNQIKQGLNKLSSMTKIDSEQNLNQMAKDAKVTSVSLRDVIIDETPKNIEQEDLSLETAFKQKSLNDLNIVSEEKNLTKESSDKWKISEQIKQQQQGTDTKQKTENVSVSQNLSNKVSSALNTLRGALTKKVDSNTLESSNLAKSAKNILANATNTLSQVVNASSEGQGMQSSNGQSQNNLLFGMQNNMQFTETQGSIMSAKTFKEHMHFTRNTDENAKELANKVMKMASKNLKEMEIDLDPKNLGKMKITVGINKDNDAASVSIAASNVQTKELLEGSLGKLRDILSQNGVETEANIYDYLEQENHNGQNQQEGSESKQHKHQENKDNLEDGLIFAQSEDNSLEVNYLTQATKDLKFGSTSNQGLSFFA